MPVLNNREVAEEFVRCFCRADVPALESLLSDNLRFNGPLLQCSSKSEYLAALSGNLEPDPAYTLDASFSDGDRAAAFYQYQGKSIAQLFVCNEGKIVETTVVFDSAKIA